MDDKLVTLYDDTNFHALMDEHKTLFNFEGVAKWKNRAKEEVDRISKVIEALEADIRDQGKELENENNVFAQKPFISRIFVKNQKGATVDQRIQRFGENKKNLSEMVSQLEEAIAFTPNSLEEQANLAQEFRQRRIELQVKKKEATPVKEIHADVRHQGVHEAAANEGSFGTVYDPKTERGTAQRRQIRYAKEALLRPNESEKTSIERQLDQVDHDILWAAKFTK